MNYNTIIFELNEGLAVITLNRPDNLNSLNDELMREFNEAIQFCKICDEVRAVLVTGRGRAFCVGADLGSINTGASPEDKKERMAWTEKVMVEYITPAVSTMQSMGKPVIMAINGVAAGGGMGLALAGDLVFAAESTTFVQVFIPQLGVIPDYGSTWFLPHSVGRARALGMMLTGDKISARQAEAWGMIWKAVADEDLMKVATEAARKLAAGPTSAIAILKKVVAQAEHNSCLEQLEVETQYQPSLLGSEDCSEAISAFFDKRLPVFKGR